MIRHYVLEGRFPKLVRVETHEELLAWAHGFEESDRRIAWTEIGDTYYVSTIFLGFDHGHDNTKPPLLFETMVFEMDDVGPKSIWGRRFITYDEAETAHREAVEKFTALAESHQSPAAPDQSHDSNS